MHAADGAMLHCVRSMPPQTAGAHPRHECAAHSAAMCARSNLQGGGGARGKLCTGSAPSSASGTQLHTLHVPDADTGGRWLLEAANGVHQARPAAPRQRCHVLGHMLPAAACVPSELQQRPAERGDGVKGDRVATCDTTGSVAERGQANVAPRYA